MNIQLSAVSAASVSSTAARAAPSPGTNGSVEAMIPQPPPQVTAQQSPSNAAIKQAAQQVNSYLQSNKSNLQFEVDSQTDKVVVRIVDSETKEVIRQIPSEEMLAISQSLDKMIGFLIAQKA
jgi:flagellar protein FlaG